jgi:hypothetical protein
MPHITIIHILIKEAFPMDFYIEIPPSQMAAEKKYIRSAIFKLLPYKEESYEYLDNYFGSVLQLLKGFNKVSGNQPEMVSIISKVAYARDVEDFDEYRKAILDACGMVERIKESDPNA